MQTQMVVVHAALGTKNDLDINGVANPFGGPMTHNRVEPTLPEQLKKSAQRPSKMR